MAKYSAELRRRAVAAVARGRSRREVAAELGVAPSTLAAWVRQAGVTETAAPSPVPAPEPMPDPDAGTEPPVAPAAAVEADAPAPEPPPVTDEIPLVGALGATAIEPTLVPAPSAPSRARPRSVLVLAAAAVLVVGVVVASVVIRGRDLVGVQGAYDQLAGVVDAAYDQAYRDGCTDTVEIVGTLSLFDRAATASLTHLSIVAVADDAFARQARGDVEDARDTLADQLVGLVPTTAQREVQAAFGTSDDVMTDCLAATAPQTVDRVESPTPTDVADLRELLDTIGDSGVDRGNLPGIRDAILAIAPVLDEAADALLTPEPGEQTSVDRDDLADAADAVVGSAAEMQTRGTPSAVLDTASLLADYAYVGESIAGQVPMAEDVPLTELPSVSTPMVTPEPELVDAVEDIPDEVGPPPPGPQPDPLPEPRPEAPTTPGTTRPSTTSPPTSPSTTRPSTPTTPSTTTPGTTGPGTTEPTTDPTTTPWTPDPTTDPWPPDPGTTDPEPTTDDPTTRDPEPTTDEPEPTTDEPEPPQPPDPDPTTDEPPAGEPGDGDEDECLLEVLGICLDL